MGRLYLKYLKKKDENRDKYYLFKSGIFYIFIDEDAIRISKIVPFNLIKLEGDIYKCGFPLNSFDKYMRVFNNLGIEIEVVDNSKNVEEEIIKKIRDLDVNKLTPLKAINILCGFKEKLDE